MYKIKQICVFIYFLFTNYWNLSIQKNFFVLGTRYRGTYYEDSYYERREASYGSDHEPSYELRAAGDYPSGMGLKRQVVVVRSDYISNLIFFLWYLVKGYWLTMPLVIQDSKFHHKDTVQISRSTIDSFDELYSDAEYTRWCFLILLHHCHHHHHHLIPFSWYVLLMVGIL